MVYYTPFRWCVTIWGWGYVYGDVPVRARNTQTEDIDPAATLPDLPGGVCLSVIVLWETRALIKWDRYSDSCICGSQCAALAVMLRPGTPRHRQTATNACGHAGSVSRSKHVFLSQQSQ